MSQAHAQSPVHLGILMPMYNERACIATTLTELVQALAPNPQLTALTVILVDDASTDDCGTLAANTWQALPKQWPQQNLQVLRLALNAGHQKAIGAGLRHAAQLPISHLAVMDADGQDDPAALAAMLTASQEADIVFAKRTKRQESFVWRLLYYTFQAIFRLALGQSLFIGNFCLLRQRVLPWLTARRDTQHLGATLALSRFRKSFVGVPRRARSDGDSKMSYLALVDYGIAAMTVSPEAWVRFFSRLALAVFAVALAGLLTVVGIKIFTDLAIPGWASVVSLNVFSIGLQSVIAIIVTTFLGRVLQTVTPIHAELDVQITTVSANSSQATWRRTS